jgi:hypothetical protein
MLSVESNRLFVMHDFEGTLPRARFFEWPQHFTITPLFIHTGMERDDVIDHIIDTVNASSPFYIEAGEQDLYGENNDRPVTRILDQNGKLHELHTSLITKLGGLGCEFDGLQYSQEKYSPHFRQKRADILAKRPYLVNTVTIAEKIPKGKKKHKRIIKKIDL